MVPGNYEGWTLFDQGKSTMEKHESNLMDTIETKMLSVVWSNLAHILLRMRGWTLLILIVRVQDHNEQLWK